MSTGSVVAVLVLSSLAAPVAGEEGPFDIEGKLPPRAAEPTLRAPLPSSPTLRLVWVDPVGVALRHEAGARREVQSILRGMGISSAWRRGRAGELARRGEVRVILLDRGASSNDGSPVLGATPTNFPEDPFVWVHVPAVRAAVGLPPSLPRPADSRRVAIALGRVVVHELVHAVAPAVPHGRGLMSTCLTRKQLTAFSLPMDAGIAVAVQAALRGQPAVSPPETRVLAVTGGDGAAR